MQEPNRLFSTSVLLLAVPWLLGMGHQQGGNQRQANVAGPAQRDEAGSLQGDDSFDRWLAGPISVLLTKEEAEIASGLVSPEEQAAFRQWFWARRDPAPETLINELQRQFHDRLSFVEKEFGDLKAGDRGWSTPRGTIHLLLGPPDGRHRIARGAVADGAFCELLIWTYGQDPLGSGLGTLRVPFIETPAGLVVLGDPASGRPPRSLLKALRAAVVETIHQPNMAFGSPLPAGKLDPTIPVSGSVQISKDGLDVDLSLPLGQLYGRAEADGLRIDLTLSFVDLPPGGEVPTPQELVGEAIFGGVEAWLDGDTAEWWSEQNLRVAIWLPRDLFIARRPTHLVVTESSTGRQAVIPLAGEATEIPDHYAVEQILGVGGLAQGEGFAVAFIEAGGPSSLSPGSLWLARQSSDLEGEELHLGAKGLRLLRLRDAGDESRN